MHADSYRFGYKEVIVSAYSCTSPTSTGHFTTCLRPFFDLKTTQIRRSTHPNLPRHTSAAKSTMEKLVHIPKITKLSPLVSRFLGMNPGKFSLQGTNTYLIGRGPRRVLIDTGEGADEYTDMVADYLKDNHLELDSIILSHWHADHTKGTVPLLSKLKEKHVQSVPPKVVKYSFPEMDEEKHRNEGWSLDGTLDDGQVICADLGFHLTCLLYPGHAMDHLCFWLEEENVLFSGDNVLGQGTSVFEDLTAYMKSLQGMRSTGKQRTRRSDGLFEIFPGHGPVIENGWAKISEYISQRKKRETQVFAILERGPADARTITREIYEGYPERILDAAQHTTTMQLMKLEDDGAVSRDSDGSWRVVEKAAI